jgi:hypothetical protein
MTAIQRRYGPTGPTGPVGPLGPGITGPTGPTGLDNFAVNLTSAVNYAINILDGTRYGMANYVIRCSQGADRSASDFKIINNGVDLDWVEYASLSIGELDVMFSADIVGTDIVLYAQCLTASSLDPVEIKIIRTKF